VRDAPAQTAVASPAAARQLYGAGGRIVRAVGPQNLGLLIGLAVLVLVIRTQTDKILVPNNLLDIGVAVSILGILAVAQMIVIISGGLDISIGSTASLCGVIVALALRDGASTPVAISLAVATGLAAGAINGAVIVRLSINPIITTLATFSAFAGIALVITGGLDIAVTNHFFDVIATERFAGLPYPLLMLLAFGLAAHLFLRFTVIGRHLFAMGSNEDAARNTGIDLGAYKMGVYMFAGGAAAIAGVLAVARDSLGQASAAGADLGLTAITAALLGGAALTGGRGSVPGALLGVLILGVLDNGLILMNVDPFYARIAVGILLILAVGLQQSRLVDRAGRSQPAA
jgi:ribose/xylose/arabinose/galactoside ABC-type transport system permease subunit